MRQSGGSSGPYWRRTGTRRYVQGRPRGGEVVIARPVAIGCACGLLFVSHKGLRRAMLDSRRQFVDSPPPSLLTQTHTHTGTASRKSPVFRRRLTWR